MSRSAPTFKNIASMASVPEKSELTEQDISKVIWSLGQEIDCHLSKIQSLRKRTSNLEEELRRRQETIAVRRILTPSPMVRSPAIQDLEAYPETNSTWNTKGVWNQEDQDWVNSLIDSPEFMDSPDITCNETMLEACPSSPGPISQLNGSSAHQGVESREELTRNYPMPSSRIQGPNGGPVIWGNPHAS